MLVSRGVCKSCQHNRRFPADMYDKTQTLAQTWTGPGGRARKAATAR